MNFTTLSENMAYIKRDKRAVIKAAIKEGFIIQGAGDGQGVYIIGDSKPLHEFIVKMANLWSKQK